MVDLPPHRSARNVFRRIQTKGLSRGRAGREAGAIEVKRLSVSEDNAGAAAVSSIGLLGPAFVAFGKGRTIGTRGGKHGPCTR